MLMRKLANTEPVTLSGTVSTPETLLGLIRKPVDGKTDVLQQRSISQLSADCCAACYTISMVNPNHSKSLPLSESALVAQVNCIHCGNAL